MNPLRFNLLIILPLMLAVAGCQSAGQVQRTWYKPWTWRSDKTDDERKASEAKKQAEAAMAANNAATVRAAASKVAATGAALNSRTNREPATDLASQFNAQAGALLPAVPIAELAEVKAIVSGLLSTNAHIRADAEKRLDAKDRELADLQRMTGELRAKLDAAEQSHESAVSKLTEAYANERGVADKWRQEQAKNWGQKLLDILGTGGLIALASTGVLSIPLAGRAFGMFARVMPSTSTFTGVVAKSDFANAVGAVENFKRAVKSGDVEASGNAVLDSLKEALSGAQNPDAEKLVDATRIAVAKKDRTKADRKKSLGL